MLLKKLDIKKEKLIMDKFIKIIIVLTILVSLLIVALSVSFFVKLLIAVGG